VRLSTGLIVQQGFENGCFALEEYSLIVIA